jgi:hypothetical protein
VARAQGAVLLVLPPRRCTYSEQRRCLVCVLVVLDPLSLRAGATRFQVCLICLGGLPRAGHHPRHERWVQLVRRRQPAPHPRLYDVELVVEVGLGQVGVALQQVRGQAEVALDGVGGGGDVVQGGQLVVRG